MVHRHTRWRSVLRLARFTREAQVLASLNHQHIGAIYGREESNGVQALVLELVDGLTLAVRIAAGPIPLNEALVIARQIAEAHERGVIHRDLKPANINIAPNGMVKVLDFGLAKVWDGAPHRDRSASPRLTATSIGDRSILGTPAYMSPEQARGLELDRRTDIWSFGCVLYEMLTGRPPFEGDTISDTLAAILEREPDRTALPADTPAPIRRLLRRCLEKDCRRRLDSAADIRLDIDDAIAAPAEWLTVAAPSRSLAAVAILAVAGGALLAGLVSWAVMRPAPQAPVLTARFAIVPPPAQPLRIIGNSASLALSPNGRYLVYRTGAPTNPGAPLMLRALDQLEAQPLAASFTAPTAAGVLSGALMPFFSPDSQWIGFFQNQQLQKVSVSGGPAVRICQVNGASLGASWGDDNTIVFATDDPATGLWRVSADGGEPTALTTPETAQHEADHSLPSVLPQGRGVLFTIGTTGQTNDAQVAVLDVNTGRRTTLIRGGSDARYVEPGYLIYAGSGSLRAVRFNPETLAVLGDPVSVVEGVMTAPTGSASYAVSQSDTLVYVPDGTAQSTPRSLVWVDRQGREEPIKAPIRDYGPPRLSPDGTQVAISVRSPDNNLWIWDFARETLRRLTYGPASAFLGAQRSRALLP